MAKKTATFQWLDKDDIRKAYFTGKLPEYLAKVQSIKEITVGELKELKLYLEKLRSEDTGIAGELGLELDEDKNVPDGVLEADLTPEQEAEIASERENNAKSIKLVNKMLNNVAQRILSKTNVPSREELIDTSLALVGLTYYIDREYIFLKRMFKKKLIEYVKQGSQRKEAEDYAMVSAEYRDLETNELLRERIKEFTMIAKKMYDNQK